MHRSVTAFSRALNTNTSIRTMSTSGNWLLSPSTSNDKVVKAEYAVRGAVVTKAMEVEDAIRDGKSLPFDKVFYCNIGNPQQLDQKPLTFARQVLSLLTYPDLLKLDQSTLDAIFPNDVVARAKKYIDAIPGGTGAYSHSQGIPIVREEVAKFIEERDGYPTSSNDVFLTDGASPAIQNVLRILLRDEGDAVMLPVPEYPLYSASVTLIGGSKVDYYLDEESGWGLDVEELRRSLEASRNESKKNVRAIMVTNPGNPTGQCLTKENMKKIIEFCISENLILLADEVYQENIWQDEKPFHSFKKVASEMGALNQGQGGLELFSFHSVSKGFIGECGRRGGYVECAGVNKDVYSLLYKLSSVNLCCNVDGQVMVGLMTNPPKEGDSSFAEYKEERDGILASLRRRAHMLYEAFNEMEGVTCNYPQGALYAFPQIRLPEGAAKAAEERGLAPDAYYCLEMVENTGVVIVPGSGFGQKDGTFHFRTTILPQEGDLADVVVRMKAFHSDFIKAHSA